MVSNLFPRNVIGDYDIRGKVGIDFSAEHAYQVGLAFGSIVQQQEGKTVSVGQDRRKTSPMFSSMLIKGLLDSGANVIDLGKTTTPYVSSSYNFIDCDASISVTASHNPAHYNGFKFSLFGNSFFGDDLQKMYERIVNKSFRSGSGKLTKRSFVDNYINYIKRNFNISEKSKVIWDCGHGAAGEFIELAVKDLKGEHKIIRSEPKDVPDYDNSKISFLEKTKEELDKNPGFIAFTFDGDADRLVIVDEKKEVWTGDEVLCFLSLVKRIKSGQKISTVWTSKSSKKITDWLKEFEIESFFSKVGHCYLTNAMNKNLSSIGGEISGHYIFRDNFFTIDDGIFTALRFLDCMSIFPYKLNQIKSIFPKVWVSPSLRIKCGTLKKKEIMEYVENILVISDHSFELKDDSIIVNHPMGWWLIRPSQTENVVSLRCEGWNENGYMEVKNFMETTLANIGLII
ncbi:hypothetical protein [Candidatus Nesciobacter abundans]|nr:hypothetical protein [Candidatus Nesciobacter abundans]